MLYSCLEDSDSVMAFIRECFHYQTAKPNSDQGKQQTSLLEEYYVAIKTGARP